MRASFRVGKAGRFRDSPCSHLKTLIMIYDESNNSQGLNI